MVATLLRRYPIRDGKPIPQLAADFLASPAKDPDTCITLIVGLSALTGSPWIIAADGGFQELVLAGNQLVHRPSTTRSGSVFGAGERCRRPASSPAGA